MIRLLDGLVLLKEVDEIKGVKHNSNQLKKLHPEKVIIMRHTSYIYRDVLCDTAQKHITNLDDYIQLGELVDYICINKTLVRERINFMEKTGSKFFEYIVVAGMHFIKLDSEFKYLLQNFQPFLANLQDTENILYCKLLGDLKIGFY